MTDVPQRFVFDLEGVRLLDRYVVEKRIGEGGMGTVYRGRDAQLDLPVVVKVPHARLLGEEGFRTRFEREVEGLITLQHPHVVRILARGAHDGMPYLVLQYLDGGSLADRMEAAPAGRILPREALSWLEDVARALDFMHEQGILHRDVKPENILFDEHGNVFLSDFGIAKVLTDPNARLTQTGIAPGSPEYMAPEQAMGVALTGKADQYALATTLYEALSGKLPFDGETPLALLVKKQNERPVPLRAVAPEVSDAASEAVMAALAMDPAERFASVREFARAFEHGMIGTPVPTPNRGTPMLPTVVPTVPPGVVPTMPPGASTTPVPGQTPWPGAPVPESRRSRAPWAAAIALILVGFGVAIATAAGWFDRPRPRENGPVVVPTAPPAPKIAVRIESPEPDAVVAGENAAEAAGVGRIVPVAGRVEGAQGGTLEVNGKSVPLAADGTFAATPVLEDGPREIVVRYQPEDGEPVTARRAVRVDSIPPTLAIETESGVRDEAEVVVKGRVEDANPGEHLLVKAASAPLRTWGDGGRVDLTAWLEPVDLAPGEKGTLVVAGRGPRSLRFLPVAEGGDETQRVRFEHQAMLGVNYGAPQVDENTGGGFTVRIPVSLASEASESATLGGQVTYRTEGDAESPAEPVTESISLCLGRAGASCAADVPRVSAPVDTETARVSVRIERSGEGKPEAVIRFEPKEGFRLYREATDGRKPISVKPHNIPNNSAVLAGGVAKVQAGAPVAEPIEVRQGFTRMGEKPGAAAVPGLLRFDVSWQACDERDECRAPESHVLDVRWIGEPEVVRVPIGGDGTFALPVRIRPGEEVILEMQAEDRLKQTSEPVLARWWRPPADDRSVSAATPPEPAPEPTPGKSYAIRAGDDHLSKIAARAYGDASQWVRIWLANLHAVEKPHEPPSGTVIWIP